MNKPCEYCVRINYDLLGSFSASKFLKYIEIRLKQQIMKLLSKSIRTFLEEETENWFWNV